VEAIVTIYIFYTKNYCFFSLQDAPYSIMHLSFHWKHSYINMVLFWT